MVVARFEGHLSGPEGLASLTAFVAALGTEGRDVAFDIRDMQSYDKGAR